MAEALINWRLSNSGVGAEVISVGSAGTHALVGSPMDHPVLAMLERSGVPGGNAHRARALSRGLVEGADLILALAREHRDWIVREWPAVARRVFTLRELAHIATHVPLPELVASPAPGVARAVQTLSAVVANAASGRGLVRPPLAPDGFDVTDPYRRPLEVYNQMQTELTPAALAVADLLAAALKDPQF
jgi:protein-tyrosine phosphatase